MGSPRVYRVGGVCGKNVQQESNNRLFMQCNWMEMKPIFKAFGTIIRAHHEWHEYELHFDPHLDDNPKQPNDQ